MESMTTKPIRALVVGVLVLLTAASAVVALNRWVMRNATNEAMASARTQAEANAGLFSSELQKYRLLPLVLAENTDVLNVLRTRHPEAVLLLNSKLKSLADHTGSAAIYVLDSKGTTLASSNYDLSTSFVGQNYAFRPYFRKAMQGQPAEFFALGTVSRRPGLYLAKQVSGGAGVVVTKIEFDGLEDDWARQPGMTIIRNHSGIVTASSVRPWLLHASRELERTSWQEEQRRVQFGAARPASLPFTLPAPAPQGEVVSIDKLGKFVVASEQVPVTRWTLSTFEPLAPALAAAKTRALALSLTATLVLVVIFGLLFRSLERRRMLVRTRSELEIQVTERTAELSEANRQLVKEVAERERANQRLRETRNELAQANRLGSIGQITTGVAHEINQPVAAIRTFAESARILITKADTDETDQNLEQIIALTDRIGKITNELRAFARRDPPVIGPVVVADAVERALLLMADRIRNNHVKLTKPDGLSQVAVLADPVRLEQVIINLLQNALDALAETRSPHIHIALDAPIELKEVTLTFSDNGPGIPAEMREIVFRPFVTGKPQGLGLGLGIAQDIVRDFGGELSLAQSALGGARFSVTLERA